MVFSFVTRLRSLFSLLIAVLIFIICCCCSGGRDQVVHLWDLAQGTIIKTVPVFEVMAMCHSTYDGVDGTYDGVSGTYVGVGGTYDGVDGT